MSWKVVYNKHSWSSNLKENDKVFYFDEYHYEDKVASRVTQDVFDFKIKPQEVSTNPNKAKAKASAIHKFGKIIKTFPFFDETKPIQMGFIPPSIAKGNYGYDTRFDELGKYLKENIPNVKIVAPIKAKQDRPPFHGNKGRSPQVLIDSWDVYPLSNLTEGVLWVIDDVITSGTSFATYKQLVEQNYKGVYVMGICWLRK